MITIAQVSCCDDTTFEVVDGARLKSGSWDVREIRCPRCTKTFKYYAAHWATASAATQIRRILRDM